MIFFACKQIKGGFYLFGKISKNDLFKVPTIEPIFYKKKAFCSKTPTRLLPIEKYLTEKHHCEITRFLAPHRM